MTSAKCLRSTKQVNKRSIAKCGSEPPAKPLRQTFAHQDSGHPPSEARCLLDKIALFEPQYRSTARCRPGFCARFIQG
jgi:hypothetical protein